jgi:hypothetical protein
MMNDEHIRTIIEKEVSQILKDFLDNSNSSDHYENFYVGKVVDNKDPEQLGRCKIRVFGVFGEEIIDNDLPWALPENQFTGSLVGSLIIPPVNSIVRVYFDRGEIYLPIYTTKVIDKNNKLKNSNYQEDYPDSMVFFETDNGDYFKINRKKKETTFEHTSGTKIVIKGDGSVNIEVVKNETEDIAKNKTTTIGGNEQKDITGSETINANKIDINSQTTITVNGPYVKITGGTLQVNGVVAPTGTGPFCALPFCTITGAPQSGNIVTGT